MFNILINQENIIITRKDVPVVDQSTGNISESVEQVVEAEAKVSPITGNELMRLGEGYKDKEVISIFSETEIKNNDTITRKCEDDKPYKVVKLRPYEGILHSFFEAIAILDN